MDQGTGRECRIPVRDGELVVDEAGSGQPVVLVHGFSFDRSLWDPQVPALAARHRVVRYDLRGFGESTPPVDGRGHVEDLLDLLDALGIARAHLVGLSLGANVVLAAAADVPGRVASVVLASPGLPGHRWTAGARPPDEVAAHARTHGVEAAKRFWLEHPIFASVERFPAARESLHAMVGRFPGHQWREGPAAPPLPPLADRLGSVDVPALVLNGELDVPGYREIGRLLGDRLPRARHLELPGVGHVLNLEAPREVNAVLVDFLSTG